MVVGARGLLVREDTGRLWRLLSDGTMQRLPPVGFDGVPVAPDRVVTGPARVLLGTVSDEAALSWPTVMISYDEGESWLVEQIRG